MNRVREDKAYGDVTDPRRFTPLSCTIMDGPMQGRKVKIPNKTEVGECLYFERHQYRYVGFGHFRHVDQGVPE